MTIPVLTFAVLVLIGDGVWTSAPVEVIPDGPVLQAEPLPANAAPPAPPAPAPQP
jgi:hypothetical protein